MILTKQQLYDRTRYMDSYGKPYTARAFLDTNEFINPVLMLDRRFFNCLLQNAENPGEFFQKRIPKYYSTEEKLDIFFSNMDFMLMDKYGPMGYILEEFKKEPAFWMRLSYNHFNYFDLEKDIKINSEDKYKILFNNIENGNVAAYALKAYPEDRQMFIEVLSHHKSIARVLTSDIPNEVKAKALSAYHDKLKYTNLSYTDKENPYIAYGYIKGHTATNAIKDTPYSSVEEIYETVTKVEQIHTQNTKSFEDACIEAKNLAKIVNAPTKIPNQIKENETR